MSALIARVESLPFGRQKSLFFSPDYTTVVNEDPFQYCCNSMHRGFPSGLLPGPRCCCGGRFASLCATPGQGTGFPPSQAIQQETHQQQEHKAVFTKEWALPRRQRACGAVRAFDAVFVVVSVVLFVVPYIGTCSFLTFECAVS